MRVLTCGLVVAICGVALFPARAQVTSSVEVGIRRFRDLDDKGAAAIFQGVLRKAPKAAVAAKCHLYLGLIALNALDADRARGEFKQAIDIDPTVEPPRNASPKAWLIYNQVRAEAAQGTPAPAAPPPNVVVVENEVAKPPPPSAAPAASPLDVSFDESANAGASHLPAYLVGGVGAAAVIAGIAFGVVSNSTLSSANAAHYANDAESLGAQVGTDRLVADVFFGAAVVAGATAVILFLTERSSAGADTTPPSAAAPLLEGRF